MKKTPTSAKPCPTCGTCPTCGAAKPVEIVRYIAQPYPVYMWPYSPLPSYNPPVYPIYPSPVYIGPFTVGRGLGNVVQLGSVNQELSGINQMQLTAGN
jgi:hypothetical protein